eukprot:CAMPEP_0115011952 /NCGR_PEP_ID=MMETSP0216-20121206/24398_1 /TAXON_ID=223996 /ORGANISM="Protocruzia adherens, Strain Boccale" /LENGTH=38 /DNA_ID= /DNA_START= /DNA_END= /DNA_ORIENTATION=
MSSQSTMSSSSTQQVNPDLQEERAKVTFIPEKMTLALF